MRDYLLRAGWIRAAWMTALFWGIGLGIVLVFRWWAGWEPLFKWDVITVVATLTAAPIGFLAGIGAFDYWVRYAIGSPTEPEDHSTHGGKTWEDYFRPNTDHKVIGIQYLVTTIFFFVVAGLMAMIFRAELARPGMQFVDNQTFNGLVSVHAALMIFLFVIPAFAGLGELRDPADDRRAGHGVPAPERALVLAAADRRRHDVCSRSRPRRGVRDRVDELRAVGHRTSRWGRSSSTWASSGRVRRRS